MASQTKSDLATRVLRMLRVIGSDDPVSAADGQIVEKIYDELREELIDKGLAYWPNTNRTTAEIPNVVFSAVAHILASRCATVYGKAEPTVTDDNGRQMTAGAHGMRDLRRHMAKPASGNPVPAVYF